MSKDWKGDYHSAVCCIGAHNECKDGRYEDKIETYGEYGRDKDGEPKKNYKKNMSEVTE